MKEFLKINPADNVIVAIQPLSKGTVLDVTRTGYELGGKIIRYPQVVVGA